MEPDRMARMKNILLQAAKLADDERKRFLQESCGDDYELQREIELALTRESDATRLMETSGESPSTAQRADSPPDRIGPYRILELIGEGGMGIVYLAEQTEPVRRRVAIKIIKAGMDSKAILARFDAERQALAMMDHPNIAKVYDAGQSEQGRPYFVMELVKGVSITDYCDRQRLSTRERLELFISVCHAVQHAHHKGVIHRDLKPTNILVTETEGKVLPKVIDFGVAKATAISLTEQTVFTQHGQLVGTPEYMSPEQAGMGAVDIDTRSDIYSLGVVLYELLTGVLPFSARELQQAGLEAIIRCIREGEPAKPSARVSSLGEGSQAVAMRRRTEIRTLARSLRGDIDWIILRAMEKDRTRRYETPNALLQDIERHLRDEPVQAGPPSAIYALRKMVRRHRVPFAVASTIILLLLGFGFWMSVLYQKAADNLDRALEAEATAENEAAAATQVSDFLIDLFAVSDPGEAKGETITAREILDRGSAKIEEGLEDQPLIQARLMETMGTVYWKLGLYDESLPILRSALEIRENVLGPEHLDVATSLNDLAIQLATLGDYDGARPLFERSLQIKEKKLGPDDPAVLRSTNNLALLLQKTGDYEGAIRLNKRALETKERTLGPDHPSVASSLSNLAIVYANTGEYEMARQHFERAIELQEAALGPEHPTLARDLTNLAGLLHEIGDNIAARPLYIRAIAIREKALGPDHPALASSLTGLANVLIDLGERSQAQSLLERALGIYETSLGPEHPSVAQVLSSLASLLTDAGEHERALSLLERAFSINEQALGARHPTVGISMENLASLHRDMGNYDLAGPLYERSRSILEEALGPDHPYVAENLTAHAILLRAIGDSAKAGELDARATSIREKQGDNE